MIWESIAYWFRAYIEFGFNVFEKGMHIYLTYGLFIPALVLMHFFVSTFEYRLNGGSESAWKGYKQSLSFYTPGGWKRRIPHLKQFFNLNDKFEVPKYWQHDDEAHRLSLALKLNDQKELRSVSLKLLGSSWGYWLETLVLASVLTVMLGAFLSMVVLLPIAILLSVISVYIFPPKYH